MLPLLRFCIGISSLALADGGLDTPGSDGGKASLSLPNLAAEKTFDGMSLPQYDKFWEKWHLVTVRFRKDNGEQRFIYANDLAYQAMREGRREYPDGAMFGKVAFLAKEDRAFPNSLEPNSFTRLQLMKKDAKAYKDSNGWGYAFSAKGTGVPYATEKTTVTACLACHRLVPDRDYVFSKPTFAPASVHSAVEASLKSDDRLENSFADRAVSELPELGRKAISAVTEGKAPATVRYLEMPLFAGSVEESVGVLGHFAVAQRKPFLLADGTSGYLLAAAPLPPSSACAQRARLVIRKQSHSVRTGESKFHVQVGTACNGVNSWEKNLDF